MQKLRVVTYSLVVVLGVVLALFLRERDETSDSSKDVRASYLKGGDFTLSRGAEKLTLSALKGDPVVLYFGYTFCPDVCPVGLAVIRDALLSDPVLSRVKVLFVTVDPERDTPQRLADYVGFFHPAIQPLHGSEAEIKQVAQSYGTYFMRGSGNNDTYTVDHTAYFYVIDGQGELQRVLDHSTTAAQLSAVLKEFL